MKFLSSGVEILSVAGKVKAWRGELIFAASVASLPRLSMPGESAGWGGHPDTTSSGQNMGNRLPNILYQQVGDAGSRQGPLTLCSFSNKPSSSDQMWQCYSVSVHQPSRGYTIEPLVSPQVAIIQLVQNTRNYANRSTCPRRGERPSRCVVTWE